MNVYKFKARTIGEATARVKNELGPDALILSTKRLDEGGNNQQFEITAFLAGAENEDVAYKELKNDLMGIMDMVFILNHSNGMVEKMALNPPILKFYAKLIRSGVNTAYAKTFMEKGGAFQDFSAGQTDNNVKINVIKEIMKTVEVSNPLGKRNSGRVISALIGTTGVGKTTTIAKIAARLMLKSKKNIGLISIDNYRIGAIEQLKTYANILGIPCFPAFNRKDLLFALKRLGDKDVVLIDTAGQSQYDSSRIDELKKMMTDDLEITSHLLLSVSTSEKEMERTAINFKPLNCESYIFTKIDEAECCGAMINQLMKLNLPISYITTGQNVPEDIISAQKADIMKLILNKN